MIFAFREFAQNLCVPLEADLPPVSATMTVTMNKLGVDILLYLRIDWERTKLLDRGKIDTFSVADGEDIAKAVFKALNVKACTVCSMYLKVSNTTISPHSLSDLDFVLTVTTNVDCQYDSSIKTSTKQ